MNIWAKRWIIYSKLNVDLTWASWKIDVFVGQANENIGNSNNIFLKSASEKKVKMKSMILNKSILH
jgi:hypothetical protein